MLRRSASLILRAPGGGKKAKGAAQSAAKTKIPLYYRVLHKEEIPRVKYTPEELKKREAIALEYNKQCLKRNLQHLANLQEKERLRNEAIAALPLELQDEANVFDDAVFPKERRVWTDTLPASTSSSTSA